MDHNDKIEEKGANFDGNVNNELLDQFKQIETKKEKDQKEQDRLREELFVQ